MKRLLSAALLILAVVAPYSSSDERDDPSMWTPVKISGEQAAPEFEDIAAWINSKPLTMKELKGKVAVVHFMAFG